MKDNGIIKCSAQGPASGVSKADIAAASSRPVANFWAGEQEFGCADGGMLLQNYPSQVWPLPKVQHLNSGGADFPKIQHSVNPVFRVCKGSQIDPKTKSVISVRL